MIDLVVFASNALSPGPFLAANERTFLAWLSMATTLGTVGTAIAGFAVEDADAPSHHKGGISQGTVELITLLVLPISICMIGYALFTFYWRSEFIRRKQVSRRVDMNVAWAAPLCCKSIPENHSERVYH